MRVMEHMGDIGVATSPFQTKWYKCMSLRNSSCRKRIRVYFSFAYWFVVREYPRDHECGWVGGLIAIHCIWNTLLSEIKTMDFETKWIRVWSLHTRNPLFSSFAIPHLPANTFRLELLIAASPSMSHTHLKFSTTSQGSERIKRNLEKSFHQHNRCLTFESDAKTTIRKPGLEHQNVRLGRAPLPLPMPANLTPNLRMQEEWSGSPW